MENPSDFKRMFFAYRALTKLEGVDAKTKDVFSYGLRYGKMAIIAAIGAMELDKEITKDNVDGLVEDKIKEIASKWGDFENSIIQKPGNEFYFEKTKDFDNYFKGSTVNSDVKEFFGNKKDVSAKEADTI